MDKKHHAPRHCEPELCEDVKQSIKIYRAKSIFLDRRAALAMTEIVGIKWHQNKFIPIVQVNY